MPFRLVLAVCLAALVSLSVRPAAACNAARQSLLYPLGTVGEALVALKLDQSRGGGEEGIRWIMRPALVRIERDGRRTVVRALPSTKTDMRKDALRTLIERLAAEVEEMEGFAALDMTERVQCERVQTCGSATLDAKGFSLARAHALPLRFPPTQLDVPDDELLHFHIAATRSFSMAGGRWTVIDARRGDDDCRSVADPKDANECAQKVERALPMVAPTTEVLPGYAWHHGDDRAVAVWVPDAR